MLSFQQFLGKIFPAWKSVFPNKAGRLHWRNSLWKQNKRLKHEVSVSYGDTFIKKPVENSIFNASRSYAWGNCSFSFRSLNRMSFCLTTNAFTHSLYSNNTTVMSETKWKVNTSSIHEIAMSNSINSNCYHSARHPQFWSENKGRWAIVDLIWLECRKKWTDCI